MQSKPRILVNRSGALGDIILTTPIIRKLYRDRQGFCEISIRTFYPEVFRDNPYITKTYPANESIPLSEVDIFVNLDLVYERNPARHVLDAYGFFAFGNISFDRQCELFTDDKDRITAETIFQKWPHGYIVIHMRRTLQSSRNLPEKFWSSLTTGLLANTSFGIIQIGSVNDLAFGGHERLVDLRGKLSIQQLQEVIRRARCFVGVDSAPAHVAGTTDTNMAVFFTTAKAEYRQPFRRNGLFKALTPNIDCYGCLEHQPIGTTSMSCARGDDECVNRFDWESAMRTILELAVGNAKNYMKSMFEIMKGNPSNIETEGTVNIVKNYDLIATIPDEKHINSIDTPGERGIVLSIPEDKTRHISLLDINFGLGSLGEIVKTNDETRHWEIDGIDGNIDACHNRTLFEKKYYRNIWHGKPSQIPESQLRTYDIICLFDVIEHLDAPMAKQLLTHLLDCLGKNSVLVISTPLWFSPQDQQCDGNLEEHKIGVPATSLFSLQPTMYHIHPKFLVGTFVFTRESLKHIDAFAPTSDRGFDFNAGLQEVQRLGQKADGILYFVTPAKDSTSEAPQATQQPSATVSKETIALFTIVYSPETQTRIVPGTEPLDNISNDRPDWREYWAIRRHLLQNSLEDDVYYGFLSPKFPTKTGMNGNDVRRFIRTHAEPLPDVFTFSPQADLGAFFLNTFEQGEAFDAGLMAAAKEIARQAGIADDLGGIVMDSRQTVFSNYFVANKRFWKRWFDVCEMVFAICEAGTTPLAEALNHPTTYPGAVPRKVFLIERIASLLLATEPWTVIPYSTFNCAWSGLPTANFRDEAITSDALKMAFNMTRDKNYLDAFSRLRNKVFYSNNAKDSDAGKPSSK